ncbi:MAG: RpiB/LacA/LacB family sugar-phosphate isomerase [archaeon]|nr:RpiB/LacA/LacB family sugar-phosphate isomerase [archaeon]
MGKKIYLGSDHAGFKLKRKIERWLHKKNMPYEDLGNITYDPEDDYPDFAELVARKSVDEKSFGILICGSAQGVCIAANKIKGARAVIPSSKKETILARLHNDANILCLSGWKTGWIKAISLIKAFLTTPFSSEERHKRRLNKIKSLEEGKTILKEDKSNSMLKKRMVKQEEI